MKKKGLIVVALASLLALSSTFPAYASDQKLTHLNEKALKQGVDITGLTTADAKAKLQQAVQAKEQAEAQKLGIDISGLSPADVKAKLVTAKAAKLGIDITGLSTEEIKAKLQEAAQAKKNAKAEKQAAKEQKQAAKTLQ